MKNFLNVIIAPYFWFWLTKFRKLFIDHCYEVFNTFFSEKIPPSIYSSNMNYKWYEVQVIITKPE